MGLTVVETATILESLKIYKTKVYSLTGHDLMAFKMLHADRIFASMGVKSQKRCFPLATRTMTTFTPHITPTKHSSPNPVGSLLFCGKTS